MILNNKFKLNTISTSVFILLAFYNNSYASCELTNLSTVEKSPDGEFSIKATGDNCNLSSLVGSIQKDGFVYGHVSKGNIITNEISINNYKDLITNISEDIDNNGNYLIISSQRPAGQTLKIDTGATLTNNGNLFIDSSVTNAHALAVYGKASINGNLVIKSTAGEANTAYYNRALYLSGGTLDVTGDFTSIHLENDKHRGLGAANVEIDNGSSVYVKNESYLYSRSGDTVLLTQKKSTFETKSSLTIFSERIKNQLTNNDSNNYGIYSLRNLDSYIKASDINVYTQGFNGIEQIGSESSIQAHSLAVDTTLPDSAETAQWSSTNSNALLINGGRGLFQEADLKSSGSSIRINSNSSFFSLGDTSINSISDLSIDSSKAHLNLGSSANITSTNSDAIQINDGVNANIRLMAGTKISAAPGHNLILDGNGNSIIEIESGTQVNGNLSLGMGEDTLNLQGQLDGTVNMGGDNDTVNLYSWNNNSSIDAGQGNADTLNIIGSITGSSQYDVTQQGIILSNFNQINITPQSTLTLNGKNITSDNLKIDAGAELRISENIQSTSITSNVTNNGLINFNHIDNKKIQTLTIDGDYHGHNGQLNVSSIWNNSNAANGTSESDYLIITGSATGKTIVSVPANIIGDITLKSYVQSSTPVVTVNGTADDSAFYGVAQTKNAGEAQLKYQKNKSGGGDFFWTLEASNGEEIYSPDIPSYVVTPYMNMELVRDAIGTYRSRKGGEYNNGYDFNYWGDKGIWARSWHKSVKSHGTERLDWKSLATGYQFGYEIENINKEKGTIRSDAYISYSFASGDTYDQFRSESAQIINNKHAGKTKTNNFNLGLTRTYLSNDNSYKDFVFQISSLKNRYSGNRGSNASNKGWAVTASFEQGFQYSIDENWHFEPMYQFMISHMRLNDFNDGYRNVTQKAHWDGLIRLGSRLYFKDPVRNNQNNLLYAKAHLVHDFASNGKTQIGSSNVREKNAKQWAEIGLGFEVTNGKSTYFFLEANIERNLGGAYRNAHSVNFGINHKW